MGYLPNDVFEKVSVEAGRVNRLIHGYISYLKRSRQGENEPGASTTIRETFVDYSNDTDTNPMQD